MLFLIKQYNTLLFSALLWVFLHGLSACCGARNPVESAAGSIIIITHHVNNHHHFTIYIITIITIITHHSQSLTHDFESSIENLKEKPTLPLSRDVSRFAVPPGHLT
jgi:hypothetical protein